MAQLGMQLPSLWRLGYRFRWTLNFGDPRLRKVWALAWPSMIAGSAVQVNVLINGMFASEIDGARSWLNCAFRLMQFPIGVFGVAIATVTLPAVARHHAREDLAGVGKTVEEALRLAFFLTVPATVGLMVLAPEIIGLIYEHWKFTASDTARTAAALRAYTIGLSGYAAIKVLAPCFYALDRPRTPLMVSLVGIGLNLVMNLTLVKVFHLGHVGLATTTGCLAVVNFIQLAAYLRRDVAYGRAAMWMRYAGAIALSALACGAAAWGARAGVGRQDAGWWWQAITLAAAMGGGAGAYLLATSLLRVDETRLLIARLRRFVQ
jgi:putative peptidoglycan lipid II flippase